MNVDSDNSAWRPQAEPPIIHPSRDDSGTSQDDNASDNRVGFLQISIAPARYAFVPKLRPLRVNHQHHPQVLLPPFPPMAEIPKPDVKVLGVGLGRTGTLSLSIALNKLGFGPCYHMVTTFQTQGAHIPLWRNVHRGINPTENLYKIFQGFQSGCDYPQALYPDALLAAFPDAKFILSVRPADKWKQSVNKTIYPSCRSMWLPSFISSFASEFYSWTQEVMWQGQFEGDFERTAEVKWDEHVEWVKKVIPPEQLLILKVGEGWEPLCKFLGVDVPDEPYPKVNDASAFKPHILGPRMLPWYAVPLYLINHYVISWF